MDILFHSIGFYFQTQANVRCYGKLHIFNNFPFLSVSSTLLYLPIIKCHVCFHLWYPFSTLYLSIIAISCGELCQYGKVIFAD